MEFNKHKVGRILIVVGLVLLGLIVAGHIFKEHEYRFAQRQGYTPPVAVVPYNAPYGMYGQQAPQMYGQQAPQMYGQQVPQTPPQWQPAPQYVPVPVPMVQHGYGLGYGHGPRHIIGGLFRLALLAGVVGLVIWAFRRRHNGNDNHPQNKQDDTPKDKPESETTTGETSYTGDTQML